MLNALTIFCIGLQTLEWMADVNLFFNVNNKMWKLIF